MMKKIFVLLLLTALILTPLSSAEFEWGGIFQNTTSGSSVGDWSLTQVDSISLWADLSFVPLFNLKFSAGYRLKYSNETLSHIPEFGTFYAYGSNDRISYKAGRFTLKDMNNNLFSTTLDGAEFGWRNQKIALKTGTGFTGLVFNDNSSVAMTSVDFQAISDDALLASPRMAEYVEAAFYILPGDGSLTAAFLAQQDLWADNTLESEEGQLNSFFINLGLKGRLGNALFYNLYGTVQAGSYNMPVDDRSLDVRAGAMGLKVDIPLNLGLKPLISVDLFYSSGDKWSRTDHMGSLIEPEVSVLNQYTPFTLTSKGYIYSVGAGNQIYGDISLSISPFRGFSVVLESLTLFRAVDGPVSELPVTEEISNSSLYLGEEITLALNFKPLSDLGFQIRGGAFIPNDSVVAEGVQYKIGGFFSLSF